MGIQGELEILSERLAGDALEKVALEEIRVNIQEQVDAIAAQAELMEAARRLSGARIGPPCVRTASLVNLIDKVCQGMSRIAERRSIVFGSFKAVRALPNVEFDWNQMRVVFVNLLHNACKYAHNRTQIEFLGEEIVLSGKRAVRVTIADFGTGINPEETSKDIFRPGFRGTIRDTKRDIEGAGMGLAVCRDIVEDVHHGRIGARCIERTGKEAESYQHCRVEVFVELPLRQPQT